MDSRYVFICGNDPDLDQALFLEQLPDVHLEFPKGNPGEDLCLLSACDYLIGAPSTYTLIAAMYHDLPLCWIMDADQPLTEAHFKHFDELIYHTL